MKKIKKIALVFAFLSWAGFSAAAAGPRRVIATRWFDIIYPPESSRSAALLAEYADALMEEVCAAFGIEPWFRLPVTFVSTTDALNASYSPVYYNRIVLYDTPPGPDLAVFDEDQRAVFYHELVHAVSLNVKPEAARRSSRVLGDLLTSPGSLWSLPASLKEGASVYYESVKHGGRLNDGFARHPVGQAKIEGRFPRWYDIAGARDIFPANLHYSFGGPFTAYLIQTCGIELYNKFWAAAGERISLIRASAGIFEKVYGVKITSIWEDFYRSFPVPEIFSPVSPASAKKLAAGGVYRAVTASRAGTAWFDAASGDVFFLPHLSHGEKAGKAEKIRKILSMRGLQRVSLSRDGAYLALSRYEGTNNHYLAGRLAVYDRERKKCFDAPGEGLRDGTVVMVGGAPYLCAVETRSQEAALVYRAITERGVAGEAAFRLDLPRGQVPLSPVDAGGGATAFVLKQGLLRNIAFFRPRENFFTVTVVEPAGNDEEENPLAGANIRDLSSSPEEDGKIYFSWARRDTFPRAGVLTVSGAEARFTLHDADVSGGEYYPAAGEEAGLFVYCAALFEESQVVQSPFDAVPCVTVPATLRPLPGAPVPKTPDFFINFINNEENEEKVRYNPFKYLGRGLFLPGVGPITVVDDRLQAVTSTSLGALYFTGTPDGEVNLGAIAGYDILSGAYGGSFQAFLQGEYLTSTFMAQGIFNRNEFEQTLVEEEARAVFPLGYTGYLAPSNTLTWFYGREGGGRTAERLAALQEEFAGDDSLSRELDQKNTARYTHTLRNVVGLSFTTLRSRGLGFFNTGGLTLGVHEVFWYLQDLQEGRVFNNLGFSASVAAPFLLPFRNPRGLTLNLPCTLAASLYPASDYDGFLSFSAAPTLFAVEVQRGLGSLLYLNRVFIDAAYTGTFFSFSPDQGSWQIRRLFDDARRLGEGEMTYTDTVRLSALATFSGNTGLVTGLSFSLGLDVTWRLRDANPAVPDVALALRLF